MRIIEFIKKIKDNENNIFNDYLFKVFLSTFISHTFVLIYFFFFSFNEKSKEIMLKTIELK